MQSLHNFGSGGKIIKNACASLILLSVRFDLSLAACPLNVKMNFSLNGHTERYTILSVMGAAWRFVHLVSYLNYTQFTYFPKLRKTLISVTGKRTNWKTANLKIKTKNRHNTSELFKSTTHFLFVLSICLKMFFSSLFYHVVQFSFKNWFLFVRRHKVNSLGSICLCWPPSLPCSDT